MPASSKASIDEAEEGRAGARERRGGVEQPLLERDDGAELPEPAEHARLGVGARERAAREAERARADLDADVRHAAEERHALLEHVLERRRGDAGRDRDDGGAGVDQLRGLAQHALDVDRLDGDQHDVGAAHELGVVGDVLHAQPLGQARRPPRAAIGRRGCARPAPGSARSQPSTIAPAMLPAPIEPSTVVSFTRRMVLAAASPERRRGWLGSPHDRRRLRPGAASAAPCATRCAGRCAASSSATASSAAAITARAAPTRPSAARDVTLIDPEGAAALVPGPAERDRRRARLLRPLRLEPVLARARAARPLGHGRHARRRHRPAHRPAHLGRAARRLGARRTSLPRLPRGT